MSFAKAKLKRFNDVDVVCSSPAATKLTPATTNGNESTAVATSTPAAADATATSATTTTTTSSSTGHTERKEQIEKFFKDAVRFATNNREAKGDFAIPKDAGAAKEDKKSKGLRLFRTPSLPQRLRFRAHHTDASSNNNNNNGGSNTASSTPLHSATSTPVKSVNRLKGKEALQQELRKKNELIENYVSQLDVLKRHVEQLKEADQKLREEHAAAAQQAAQQMQAFNVEQAAHQAQHEQLAAEHVVLVELSAQQKAELHALTTQHKAELEDLQAATTELNQQKAQLEHEVQVLRADLANSESKAQQHNEMLQNLKNTNDAMRLDLKQLQQQLEQDALAYAQENKIAQHEMDCLKNERNTLKNDLASKCELIRTLQEEILDKTCEIDAHCDTIRQLCRENAKYVEKERLMESAEEKVRNAELHAEHKLQKLESDMERALEREKAYWRGELEKRQKLAENEVIKIELEKQDVMVLLETTNDMLRERDEKLHKYEEQLRNGIDYYVQLTDQLQKQVVDLKQDIAKTITEKYNYQLTLNNTRATVNILMERLKKSDADVEQFKAELESVQLAKGALEQSYLSLQEELEAMRSTHAETEAALQTLTASSQTLQHEVSLKDTLYQEIQTSEEATLAKLNKIAASFQERIGHKVHDNVTDAIRYQELCHELKQKDEMRESYMQDMKKALDDFATVMQLTQIELDNKEKTLMKAREECEQLKLENITLKSKIDEAFTKKENSTDLEKIEDLFIESELRNADCCDNLTTWLLTTNEKGNVHNESAHEIGELLKPTTPNNNKARTGTTPLRGSGGKMANNNTPRTPKTPRTTPKRTVLFPGKENVLSPQRPVLKARNM